jgi:antitoxin PrlF
MLKKKVSNAGPGVSPIMDMGCCAVEAIVTVDERGQMVLPKELREKAGIKAGDKLAVTSWKKDGEVCCITLIKAGNLGGMVRTMLGPVMKDLL